VNDKLIKAGIIAFKTAYTCRNQIKNFVKMSPIVDKLVLKLKKKDGTTYTSFEKVGEENLQDIINSYKSSTDIPTILAANGMTLEKSSWDLPKALEAAPPTPQLTQESYQFLKTVSIADLRKQLDDMEKIEKEKLWKEQACTTTQSPHVAPSSAGTTVAPVSENSSVQTLPPLTDSIAK